MSMALLPMDFNSSMGMSSIPRAIPLARDSKADLTSSFVTCGSGENGWGVYTSLMDGSWWYSSCACTLSTILSLEHPQ